MIPVPVEYRARREHTPSDSIVVPPGGEAAAEFKLHTQRHSTVEINLVVEGVRARDLTSETASVTVQCAAGSARRGTD